MSKKIKKKKKQKKQQTNKLGNHVSNSLYVDLSFQNVTLIIQKPVITLTPRPLYN